MFCFLKQCYCLRNPSPCREDVSNHPKKNSCTGVAVGLMRVEIAEKNKRYEEDDTNNNYYHHHHHHHQQQQQQQQPGHDDAEWWVLIIHFFSILKFLMIWCQDFQGDDYELVGPGSLSLIVERCSLNCWGPAPSFAALHPERLPEMYGNWLILRKKAWCFRGNGWCLWRHGWCLRENGWFWIERMINLWIVSKHTKLCVWHHF